MAHPRSSFWSERVGAINAPPRPVKGFVERGSRGAQPLGRKSADFRLKEKTREWPESLLQGRKSADFRLKEKTSLSLWFGFDLEFDFELVADDAFAGFELAGEGHAEIGQLQRQVA